MKKKIMALFLCAMLVLTCFASCVNNEGPSKQPDDPQPDDPQNQTVLDKAIAKYKSSGERFYFAASFIQKAERDYTEEDRANPPGAASRAMEAMMNQVKRVEDEYGIILEMNGSSELWKLTNAEIVAQLANEIKMDMYHTEIRQGRDLWNQGNGPVVAFNDLLAIDVNNTEKWGGSNVLASVTDGDKIWGSAWHGSAYMPFVDFYYGILLMKNDTYDSYKIGQTPREMDEAKNWTFETFADLIERVDRDGADWESFAFAYGGDFEMPFVRANGGSVVKYNETTGKYEFGMTSNNVYTALETARALKEKRGFVFNSQSIDAFGRGEYTFYMTDSNRAFNEIAKGVTDFSWVPFPYGPDVEYGSTNISYFKSIDSVCVVVAMEDELRSQMSGLIFDRVVDKLQEYPNGYGESMKRDFFEDGDDYSFSVYEKGSREKVWTYEAELVDSLSDVTAAIAQVMSGRKTPQNAMEALEEKLNQDIDAALN